MPDPDKTQEPLTSLPFPPLTTTHILATSFPSWYTHFRPLTPKARIISLSASFITYLRSDGILLPPDHPSPSSADVDDSGYSDSDSSDDTQTQDPSDAWPEIHQKVKDTIRELGGKVYPKLNWSAPKDATWMSVGNSMECRNANEVYLLLKSSDFISHDLEHAFDGCEEPREGGKWPEIEYALVLRKSFNINPALEFRCFVRGRKVLAMCQREMNYFDFLFELRPKLRSLIVDFIESKILRLGEEREKSEGGFGEENFVVDVYVPPKYDKVWLIDINPWAVRTDPLLFSWLELLTMRGPDNEPESEADDESSSSDETDEETLAERGIVRIPVPPERSSSTTSNADAVHSSSQRVPTIFTPEFRLVNRDDPEAYQFGATKYSAHKLPKEVVDAGMAPGTMTEMMQEWRRVLDGQGQDSDSDGEEEIVDTTAIDAR